MGFGFRPTSEVGSIVIVYRSDVLLLWVTRGRNARKMLAFLGRSGSGGLPFLGKYEGDNCELNLDKGDAQGRPALDGMTYLDTTLESTEAKSGDTIVAWAHNIFMQITVEQCEY
jgi:hypothetical protein